MVWQKIDDQFGVSRKVIRIPRARRFQCAGLWLLALNYAGRALTNGLLEEHELHELGAREKDVAELIRVELWHGHGHQCPRCDPAPIGGAIIHDFLVYNPSRAKVEADREAERVRKASQRDKARTKAGQKAESGHPVPSRPDPDPTIKKTDHTHDSEVSHVIPARAEQTDEGFLVEQAGKLGIKKLGRVLAAFGPIVGPIPGDYETALAIDVARAVLNLSTEHVKHPEAYLESACRDTPEVIRDEWARAFAASPRAVA